MKVCVFGSSSIQTLPKYVDAAVNMVLLLSFLYHTISRIFEILIHPYTCSYIHLLIYSLNSQLATLFNLFVVSDIFLSYYRVN